MSSSSRPSLSAAYWGAILLSVSALGSRGLGVLRDYIFAKTFGVGAEGGRFALDAYFVAFKIPDFLYVMLIFGAMSAAFIPLYTQLLKKDGKERAFLFASEVMNGLFTLLFLISGICFILAPWLIPFLAQGYSPELQTLTVDLTRILLLSPLFLGLSGVLQGVENAHKSFWGAALAPLVYNGSIIAAAYWFAPTYGVYALAWGAVVGTFLHFLVQLPGTLHTGFRYRFRFAWKGKEFREFLRLVVPRLFGTSAAQVGVLFNTFLCTLLPLGSLSIYNYAFNLESIAYGVVAISVSTAVFSTLAEHADNPEHFLYTLKRSLAGIWFWVLPATVGLFLLREPVVNLILHGGKFDDSAVRLTVATLAIFVWSALPQSFVPLLTRAFYSLRETWLPVKIAFVSVVVNLAVAAVFVLIFHWSVTALALADVVNGVVNLSLLIFFLKRHTQSSLQHLMDFRAWGRTLFSTLGMVVIMLLVPGWILQFLLGSASYFLFQLLLDTELRNRVHQKIFA